MLSNLEEARENPNAFKQRMASNAAQFFTYSYAALLRDAILRFHKSSLTVDQAIAHMRTSF